MRATRSQSSFVYLPYTLVYFKNIQTVSLFFYEIKDEVQTTIISSEFVPKHKQHEIKSQSMTLITAETKPSATNYGNMGDKAVVLSA